MSLAPLLSVGDGTTDSAPTWHYAAWVALDLRLLLFSVLFAGLVSAALTATLVKSERRLDYLAAWVVIFFAMLVATVAVMNLVSAHPVFTVESFFPFP